MRRPNRKELERKLSALTKDIGDRVSEFHALVGFNDAGAGDHAAGPGGELLRCRNAAALWRQKRESVRLQVAGIRSQIDDKRRQIRALKDELSAIESKDLYFKDEVKLRQILQKIEQQYLLCNKRKDEEAFVRQIDRLHRNLNRLGKYKELLGEKEESVRQLKGYKAERDDLYERGMHAKRLEAACKREERDILMRADEITTEIECLQQEKKNIMADYDRQRMAYLECMRLKKGATTVSAAAALHTTTTADRTSPRFLTRSCSLKDPTASDAPSSTCSDDSDVSSESDFRPFAQQKKLCKDVISYLSQFLRDGFETDSVTQVNRCEETNGSDATALPTASIHDKKERPSAEASVSSAAEGHCTVSIPELVCGKRFCRKDKRKLTQSVPYSLEILETFAQLDVTPAAVYSQIPVVINEVKQKLEFYETQTSVTRFDDSWFRGILGRPSSESEHTFGSALNSYYTASEFGEESVLNSTKRSSFQLTEDFRLTKMPSCPDLRLFAAPSDAESVVAVDSAAVIASVNCSLCANP